MRGSGVGGRGERAGGSSERVRSRRNGRDLNSTMLDT